MIDRSTFFLSNWASLALQTPLDSIPEQQVSSSTQPIAQLCDPKSSSWSCGPRGGPWTRRKDTLRCFQAVSNVILNWFGKLNPPTWTRSSKTKELPFKFAVVNKDKIPWERGCITIQSQSTAPKVLSLQNKPLPCAMSPWLSFFTSFRLVTQTA